MHDIDQKEATVPRDASTSVNATDDFGTDRVSFEATGELKLGAKDNTLNFLKMAGLSSVRKHVVKSMFLVGESPDEPGDDMDVEVWRGFSCHASCESEWTAFGTSDAVQFPECCTKCYQDISFTSIVLASGEH